MPQRIESDPRVTDPRASKREIFFCVDSRGNNSARSEQRCQNQGVAAFHVLSTAEFQPLRRQDVQFDTGADSHLFHFYTKNEKCSL